MSIIASLIALPRHRTKTVGNSTIAVSLKNLEALKAMCRGRETYDDVISRYINGQIDVDTRFVSIDNELPQLHTAVLQLGSDNGSLYFWDGTDFQTVSLEEANQLMKQPKPNMTISMEEAKIIFANKAHIIRKDIPTTEVEEQLDMRLSRFLENQPHDDSK